MTLRTLLCAVLLLTSLPAALYAQPWSDDFDSYVAGSPIAGQGGWENWYLGANDAFVTTQQANSAPNSLEISPTSDVVQQFTTANSGEWTATAMTYIPSGSAGQQLFIMLNQYNNNGDTALSNWSTQILFDSDLGLVLDFDQQPAGPALPIINDQWVQLRNEIDLDSDTQSVFYNNQLLLTESWTDGVPGSGGILNIACIDLFSNGGTTMFYDNCSLQLGGPVAVEPTTWGALKSTFR